MARARNIKPGFFSNDELVELPFEARLLFIGLWVIADRSGRLLDRPKKIKMDVFPGDNVDCDSCLDQLAKSGFILRYEANGISAIQIVNWDKHQNPHVKEITSTIPASYEHQSSTSLAPVYTQPKPEPAQNLPERAGLIPDSLNLIPDSLYLKAETTPEPSQGQAKAEPKQKQKPAPASRLPADWLPSIDDEKFCRDARPDLTPIVVADRFRDFWIAQPGAKAKKIDWSATWRNWVRNERPGSGQARAGPAWQSANEKTKSWCDQLLGINTNEQHHEFIDITPTAAELG